MSGIHFPVTESTLSATHLATFVQEKYGLGVVSGRLLRTGMNHLYHISAGNQRWVFRVYTFEWRTQAEIQAEVDLLLLLQENGVRVAYPIPDQHGQFIQTFPAPEGVRYGVLFAFVPGKKIPQFSMAVSAAVGSLMAQIHQITAGISIERITYTPTQLIQQGLEGITAFFGSQLEDVHFLQKLAASTETLLNAANPNHFTQGVVHFDIWFDNLHVDGKQVYLFDFDFCGNGYTALDLAFYQYQLFSTHPGLYGTYEDKRQAFLKAYEAKLELSNTEKTLLPWLAIAMMIYYLHIQCSRFDTWSNIFLNEAHLKRYVDGIRKWATYHNITI